MKGLRTQESKDFVKFFEKVQKEANKKGFVFFMDFGECVDIKFKDMLIDELFGWNIPIEKSEEFEKLYLDRSIPKEWDKYCIWVLPEIKDNEIVINFE
ncbi:MAG: hypothetical protein Q4E02_00820 [Lagierella massiliensis]|nr:hypothetical protein [Lagierella massiliensis]